MFFWETLTGMILQVKPEKRFDPTKMAGQVTPRKIKMFTRWWFQTVSMFIPTWGDDPI